MKYLLLIPDFHRQQFTSSTSFAGCTPHPLHFSFATHLLEQGESHRHMQTLLGHNTVKTAEPFKHLSKKFLDIKSSIDHLLESQKAEIQTITHKKM